MQNLAKTNLLTRAQTDTLVSGDFISFTDPVKKNSLGWQLQRVGLHLGVNLVLIFAIAIAMVSFAMMNSAFAQNVRPGTPSEETIADDLVKLAAATLIRPNDVNTGSLLLPSKKQGFYIEAPRLSSDVDININGPIARVSVTQRFENPSKGWLEGVYVFPLPEDSAVDTLKMRIGNRLIEGEVKVREEARQIYEQAKREGKKAALLEQQRDNLFTNAVANIGPGETVIINIEYQQTVRQDNGLFSLRYPMVVAPRYSPQPIIQSVDFSNNGNSGFGVIDPVPDRKKIEAPVLDPRKNALINPVTLTVHLAAGFPIGEMESPFHELISKEQDESTRILTLKNESVPADRDFELTWRAKGNAPNAALFAETVGEKNYVLAFVTPPEIDLDNLPKKDREVIFVIDNSGSMAGESMTQAKLALHDALARLQPSDKFNIVRFDDTFELVFHDAVPADRENKIIANEFVSRLEADGGTEMLPALKAALIDRNSNDTKRIRQVVFITDGAIGNERQLFDQIAQGRGRSRVFTVGIGSAPNSFFMNRAAEIGRGTFTHIGSTSQVKSRMGSFFAKLENPVMTGLSVQGNGAKLSEASPNPLPDLYKGEPIVIAAIVDNLTGKLEIQGDYAGQPWQVDMDMVQASKGHGIGKLWARRKIASLEAGRSYGGDYEAINKQVETVALAHHLVSSRTSLVAVDRKVTRPSGESVDTAKVPLTLPAGWDAEKWFDDKAMPAPSAPQKAMLKKVRSKAMLMYDVAPSKEGAALVAKMNRQSVNLPQAATPAERNIILGILLIIFASLGYIVMGMYGRMGNRIRRHEHSRPTFFDDDS